MPRVARRFPAECLGFLVIAKPCYCPSTLRFAFSSIRKGHMFSYVKSEDYLRVNQI